jgi:hypothetical protein
MKKDLISEYFQRDLSALEYKAMQDLLENDMEASARFAQLAEDKWKKNGLPLQRTPEQKRARKILWASMAAGLGLALMIPAWLYVSSVRAQASNPALRTLPETEPVVRAVMQTGQAQRPSAAMKPQKQDAPLGLELKVFADNQAGRQGSFKIKIEATQSCPARLWVEHGKERRELFVGKVFAGTTTLVWKAERAGDYKVALEACNESRERWVTVDRR